MYKSQKYVFDYFLKCFSFGWKVHSGRNFLGRVCVNHQGSGLKSNYVQIDKFRYLNQFGFILRVIKNSYRSGFLGYVLYDNGLSSFILLSDGLKTGYRFFSGSLKLFSFNFNLGSSQKILNISLFDNINSIETFPFSGSKLARSAGCCAKLIARDNDRSILKLSSGWQIRIVNHALAVYGLVSNVSHIFNSLGKAGLNRNMGIRPTVRGVIKNPCDHPHGGGEGKGSPPVAQVSPWGWLCKGRPTKNKKIDRIRRKKFKKE